MIGIFDSGVGGLSIYKSVKKLLPKEGVVYLADQKNFPYGEKSQKKLAEIAEKNTQFLIDEGAKVVIVACNTASVHTLALLRKKFKIPFIGVVPAVKPAAQSSKNKNIGVLATKGTVKSKYLKQLLDEFCGGGKVFLTNGSGLVDAIEKGEEIKKKNILTEIASYFSKNNVDTVVLGCTHYHFVLDEFKKRAPEIAFIGSEKAIARQLESIIEEQNLEIGDASDKFFTTGKDEKLKSFLTNVLDINSNNIYGI